MKISKNERDLDMNSIDLVQVINENDQILLYCKMQYWTLEECSRIICGVSPMAEMDKNHEKYVEIHIIQKMLERINDSEISALFSPLVLIDQLKALQITVPDILVEECAKYDNKYKSDDYLRDVNKLKKRIRILRRKIRILEPQTTDENGKRRRTLQYITYCAISLKYDNVQDSKDKIIDTIIVESTKFKNPPKERSLKAALEDTFDYMLEEARRSTPRTVATRSTKTVI